MGATANKGYGSYEYWRRDLSSQPHISWTLMTTQKKFKDVLNNIHRKYSIIVLTSSCTFLFCLICFFFFCCKLLLLSLEHIIGVVELTKAYLKTMWYEDNGGPKHYGRKEKDLTYFHWANYCCLSNDVPPFIYIYKPLNVCGLHSFDIGVWSHDACI